MRSSILLALFALVLPVLSLRHGDVGINIAVRTDENGELVHFYEKDEIEHFEKLARREAQPQEARPDLIDVDPQSDRYPVKMDADGKVVPFTGAAGA